MREIEGQRDWTKRWEHEGFHYHQIAETPNRFRCTGHRNREPCSVEAHKLTNGTFKVSGTHEHPKPDIYEVRRLLTEALKFRGIETMHPVIKSAGEVVTEVFRE